MSLSWRKRQALASDQKTWRGLGHDSALWTSIENNASTVNAVAAGPSQATRSGIVTGLRFIKTGGLTFNAMNVEQKVYVSDPSNSSVASIAGVNQFNTPHTTRGSGLIFTFRKFGIEDFAGAPLGTDISGCLYNIDNGGSGYSIGDDIQISGDGEENGRRFQITNSATNAAPGAEFYPQLPTGNPLVTGQPSVLADGIVTQDPFIVQQITVINSTANTYVVDDGFPISIHTATPATSTNELARGFIAITGVPVTIAAGAPTATATFNVHVSGGNDFTQNFPATAIAVIDIGGVTSSGNSDEYSFTIGSASSPTLQANGFIPPNGLQHGNTPSGVTYSQNGQLSTGEFIMQTEAEFQRKAFQKAGAALRNSAGTIILSAQEMARGYTTGGGVAPPSFSTTAAPIRLSLPVVITPSLFDGVLTARVTSVADTTPVQGRN